MNAAPFARILVRYGVGMLMAKEIISPSLGAQLVSDPDFQMFVGLAISALPGLTVEAYYWAAKRYGWAT